MKSKLNEVFMKSKLNEVREVGGISREISQERLREVTLKN